MASKRGIHPGILLFLIGIAAFIGLRVYQHFNQRMLLVSQDGVWVVDIHGQEGVLNRRMGQSYTSVPIEFESHNYGMSSFRFETTADGLGLKAGSVIGCYIPGKKSSRTLFCEATKGLKVPIMWHLSVGSSAEKAADTLKLRQSTSSTAAP